MNRILIIIISFLITCQVYSQIDSLPYNPEQKNIKKGWSFGAVPALAFDSDIGFQYGGVVNLYDYGDGSTYPMYKHSLYFEISRTTKGKGINMFTYDSKYLIPNIRVSAEASFLTEKALDFYGFNGYKAYYNRNIEDDTYGNDDYRSRLYFRQERKLTRLRAEFQGNLIGEKLRWLAGISYYGIKTDTIDIVKLNKGLKDTTALPPVQGGLYGKYVDWAIIPEDQIDGGNTSFLNIGLIYDTRDNEPNPMKGIWTELQFIWAPSFIGNKDLAYTRLAITHRQYFTLLDELLSFAYRISYQGKLTGTMPYYMLPFVMNTAPNMPRDGLGGSKTLRGILRNRVVGEDFMYGNLEFRWKFYRAIIWKQNIYLALSTFSDIGMVTADYKIPEPATADSDPDVDLFFTGAKETPHVSYGVGLHMALNENFVVAVDYGRPFDKRDGKQGLYIGLNFLY